MIDLRRIGNLQGVAIEVAGWDGVGADVDLSCACMFTHEMPGKVMAGGLLHLDAALGGALSNLRAEGAFSAQVGTTIVFDRPPATVRPQALLVLGLGAPEAWTPLVMGHAVELAFEFAAFAPSLLDAGLEPNEGAASAMLGGLVSALDRARRLIDLNLASPLTLKTWTFDAGIAHLDGAETAFGTAFEIVKRRA
jgi:hypothetical protein